METLLLVDGMNLLFQMFYGMPARIPGKDGRPIHGTLGFVGALLKIIRMTGPSHVAVLFDGEYESDRRELDETYKANRPDLSQLPEEDTPFSQLPDVYRALDYLGIAHAETTICEADDWLAGYARKYGEGMDIVIVSQDSDLFQLISDRIRILRYRGKQSVIWGGGYLREKLGIGPGQYAFYKSLTGDASDNIPGVPKVGPKTAAALVNQFKTLDDLLEHTDQILKPTIRSAVLNNKQRIQKNHELIVLPGDVELPFDIKELAFQDRGCTTTEVLVKIGIK